MQEEMEGDALGYYLLFLKTHVNCTADSSPLENELCGGAGGVLVQCSTPSAYNSA